MLICRYQECLAMVLFIGVAETFSEGGQPFWPAKIQSFRANIFSCQGGKFPNSVLKTDKNDRKLAKCGVLLIIICQALISVLPSSHFCPAKHPFLSCQFPIFVLPSQLIFSGGGPRPPPPPPPPATPMIMMGEGNKQPPLC